MMTANQQGIATFQAGDAAIAQGARVTVGSDGKVTAAGAEAPGIGVTQHAVVAAGYVAVKLWNANGTFEVLAGGTIAIGDVVSAGASGAVVTEGDVVLGTAISAGADGSLVELAVAPFTTPVASSASAPSDPTETGRTALHVRWTDAGAETFHSLYAWSPTAQAWVTIIAG